MKLSPTCCSSPLSRTQNLVASIQRSVPTLLFALALVACGGGSELGGGLDGGGGGTKYLLSVTRVGSGSGRVTSAQSAGIDCGATCSASLNPGTSVTLTATAAAGSEFTGWSGSCSGTVTCTLTMDAAKAVSARFILPRVVFASSRKLDATDASNANSTSNLWRVNTDGTGLAPLTTLTANRADSGSPQWSPDGSKLVFISSRKLDGSDVPNANFTYNIWRVNADGTGLMPLTNATAAGADSFEPQWSPDGMSVLFESARRLDGADAANNNRTRNVWRVNADGTGLRILTNTTAQYTDSYGPQWSPDGFKVAFYSWRKLDGTDAASPHGIFNIWRVNADGTNLTPLTNATAIGTSSVSPQWSPDGTAIVFTSSRKLDGTDASNGGSNIWRVNADGTGLRVMTNATAAISSNGPQWSPDGTKVVFFSSRKLDGTDALNANSTFNIWRVNADGTGLTPLTHATFNRAHCMDPQWSPDGSKIVFDSSRKLDGSDAPNLNLTSNIWRVNADGTGLAPLTNATAHYADSIVPSFSP